ncbi:D-alanyl-D-alanine carboxypeptidase/D-alanyl-D-alanine-endopeptidase [Spirosoma sp. KUDC1026]|uniref:D-alanyl-D-alanine carboxypeptidase/D-alanyl-D-alanine-endopeptidase n=1 Tax=Spirosoma sp. KUDC1026 TaxID=2745947 RepID=UPI00159BB9FD|nr:D-alanyl-D-alanine carboxypeptidase [Spirosoma sp. KUDC1026]QKZ11796.1 D-alanyl-D-alanine carboxypeptidase [Spirosoma sp. KUDC1026]
MSKLLLALLTGLLLAGCSPARRLSHDLRTLPTYTDHSLGVAVYDPIRKKALIQHNADIPFTPASNTKLFSFYAGLLGISESLPALRYVVRQDSLIFWGTGNPLLLHPDLPDTSALAFLRSRPEQLFFSADNYSGPRFGPGWAWDDYNDDYSAELVSLPLYGNVVRFNKQGISPAAFRDSVRVLEAGSKQTGVHRAEFANTFTVPGTGVTSKQDVPFRWSPELAARLLSDTLHRPVGLVSSPVPADAQLLRGLSTDSLYKRMLYVSDNQFAEQVLFMLSAERRADKIDPTQARRWVADSVLRYPITKAKWVDGSGLSRYNLFTPNILIDLLGRIDARIPRQRLFALLPAAGRSGTLRSMGTSQQPYVYAKSGSMSAVYNLSGYILTQRGKTLYFSIMHNNFTQPVSEMRQRTTDLLRQIHERF